MSASLAKTNLTYGTVPVQTAGGFSLMRNAINAVRWVVTWPRRRAVLDELSRLTDRELSDIGLNRAELRSVFVRPR